jgi:hypothetical protein
MGVFVDYKRVDFFQLNVEPPLPARQTILAATAHNLLINSITVINTGEESIRFNLKSLRTYPVSHTDPIETFYTKNLEINSYRSLEVDTEKTKSTVDVVAFLGLNIVLEFDTDISDSLICYSNNVKQNFDCHVAYTVLKELPAA